MDKIKLVKKTDNAISQLAHLERENFLGEAWTEEMLEEIFHSSDCQSFAYYLDEKIIGYCVLCFLDEFCDLLNIVVSKQFQGRGIGSKMLEFCFEKCKDKSIPKLLLEVNVKNERAIKFYFKHQFRAIAYRKNFYTNSIFDSNDAYTLCKIF